MTEGHRSLRDYSSVREGEGLELKEPGVLADPRAVAREVCAFLNTRAGGKLVIGVRDDGRAMPIERPGEEKERLWSRLASLIAPSLPSRVHAEVLDGGGILVEVDPEEGPVQELYAVRFTQGRLGVFRRVGDRVVPLEWSEIRESLRRGPGPEPGPYGGSVERALSTWREELGDVERTGALLLAFEVDPRVVATPDRRRLVEEAIEDPAAIGMRSPGTNYSVMRAPEVRGKVARSGSREELYRVLEVDLRGELRFATRIDVLLADRIPGCPRTRTLYPLSLIETVLSCAVLFSELVDPRATGRVACALDLVGVQGLSIPPYPHGTYGFLTDSHWKEPLATPHLGELIRVSIDVATFAANPHRLAHDVILWVYEEFGYGSGQLGPLGEGIPYWNASAGRFEIPE